MIIEMQKAIANQTIKPKRVRYIKLGAGGCWEKECIKDGIIRFGFGSANKDRYKLCLAGAWDELKESFIVQGKNKATATRFTKETRRFFEDTGSTLWITFVGERMYWGFLESKAPERHSDGDGVWRTVAGGWKCVDVKGEKLTKDCLSGSLTKLASYRGTSCSIEVAEYLVRRINGEKTPEVERALDAIKEIRSASVGLMKLLGPKDFELLVDLVFTTSGWRRLGVLGKTQKTLDLDLLLPSTGERAFVQIKSETSSKELADYVAKIDEAGQFDRMFYVYHSGKAVTDDKRVMVIGPEKLAELVVDAGLVGWLIGKTA